MLDYLITDVINQRPCGIALPCRLYRALMVSGREFYQAGGQSKNRFFSGQVPPANSHYLTSEGGMPREAVPEIHGSQIIKNFKSHLCFLKLFIYSCNTCILFPFSFPRFPTETEATMAVPFLQPKLLIWLWAGGEGTFLECFPGHSPISCSRPNSAGDRGMCCHGSSIPARSPLPCGMLSLEGGRETC